MKTDSKSYAPAYKGPALCLYLLIAALILAVPGGTGASEWKVTRVYDGDTLKAKGYGIEIKVRLVGIDAPEMGRGKRKPGQPFSQKGKEFLAGLVLDKMVVLKGYGAGPYNRPLAVVYLDGKDVNLELIKAGFAEVYPGKAPRGFDLLAYKTAEADAKRSMRGVWSLGPDQYVSPTDWRKRMRK